MRAILFVLSLILSCHVLANEVQPKVVQVPITDSYIPRGFDSNDKVQFVVEGYLPNSCYRIGPTEVQVNGDTRVIEVKQTAYKYSGICLQMIIPFNQVVEVGILNQGDYRVREFGAEGLMGELPIKISLNSEPDDFLYAGVNDAIIYTDTLQRKILRIEGFFPDTCTQLKEIRTINESDKVLTVLPIATRVSEDNCRRLIVPFTKEVTLQALNKGRRLLHVRSLNGQAVNKLFNIGD